MEKQPIESFVEDTDEGDESGWVWRCVISLIYTLISTMLTSSVTHCVMSVETISALVR